MLKTGMIIAERYEIVGKIGTGGMADVYKAMDHKLNRFVAVKVLKPEFREDTTFIKKFRSEAQAAAGLTHPNIVNVFDVGDDGGVYYIVMELSAGVHILCKPQNARKENASADSAENENERKQVDGDMLPETQHIRFSVERKSLCVRVPEAPEANTSNVNQ